MIFVNPKLTFTVNFISLILRYKFNLNVFFRVDFIDDVVLGDFSPL